MRYTVKIAGRAFEVEIVDLYARPIIAVVDGQSFEVMPQDIISPPSPSPARRSTQETRIVRPATPPASPAAAEPGASANQVHAPIPGLIVSLAVEPGAVVAFGQELCVLEAMKMKNAIRAARAGTISAVHVSVGQQVKHHDLLMEYAES